MPNLHLTKVAFACRDLEALQERVARRATDGEIRIATRMRPKRADELIGGKYRLLAPLGEETPVGKFLAKRGPGLHHVAYQVTDIDAALAGLREAGVRMIDEQPRTGIRSSRVAFLHPGASGGVLTELVEPAEVHA